MTKLTEKMRAALEQAARGGVYHEFANTSTINALRRRGYIQSMRRVGWHEATEAGRALLAGDQG